jgi:hypothetical protein
LIISWIRLPKIIEICFVDIDLPNPICALKEPLTSLYNSFLLVLVSFISKTGTAKISLGMTIVLYSIKLIQKQSLAKTLKHIHISIYRQIVYNFLFINVILILKTKMLILVIYIPLMHMHAWRSEIMKEINNRVW